MNTDFQLQRSWIVAATKSVTMTGRKDPEVRARLDDPNGDCTFEELHFDSLARMELCIWMQTEVGGELGDGEVRDQPSVNARAAYLAGKGASSS